MTTIGSLSAPAPTIPTCLRKAPALRPATREYSSLPGRPALQCASTNNVLAKLVMAAAGNGPIVFAAGANHYRLTGLEVTRVAGTGIVYALSSVATGGTANNLIFDRVWMHGTAQDETNTGIDLGGSYVCGREIPSLRISTASRSQGPALMLRPSVAAWVTPLGPFKIVDNFLEASGENILFGGGAGHHDAC